MDQTQQNVSIIDRQDFTHLRADMPHCLRVTTVGRHY